MYISTLMIISLLFSIGSYAAYSRTVEQNIRRPLPQIIRNFPLSDIQDVILDRNEALQKSKNEYRLVLVVINLSILLGGGFLSYYLARRTLRPIEKAHEAQSRFTADASHELRTPITAMRVETELTLTEPKLTLKQAKGQLESNIEELDKLTTLSESLLQLAKADGELVSTDKVPVDRIIDYAIARVAKKLKSNKQSVKITGEKDIVFTGSESALVESLVTIIDNAIKYSPKSSSIRIRKKKESGRCIITISDSGSGISKKDLPHIFERFYRGDASRTASDENGYGIGLSIAKSLIEANGGSIKASSASKGGAVFTVTLLT